TIGFHDERPGHEHEATFHNDAGIVDFVRHLNASKEPLIRDVGSFTASEAEGDVEVAWQWNTGYHEGLHTFANGISTTEGGMHAEGFKRALIHGPAGLDLGAEGPEEIAAAICAEIVAIKRGRGAGFLKDRPGPIHERHAPAR
ncbi:MAG: hypothetical protein ACXWXS_09035, partial [Actinomycetota bacterium]